MMALIKHHSRTHESRLVYISPQSLPIFASTSMATPLLCPLLLWQRWPLSPCQSALPFLIDAVLLIPRNQMPNMKWPLACVCVFTGVVFCRLLYLVFRECFPEAAVG